MKLPSFTVRWLMIAVAVVGVFLGLLAERRARFLRIVAERKKALASDPGWVYQGLYLPKEIVYRWEMIEKYERAARYPWLPIEPDLPALPVEPDPVNHFRPAKDAELPIMPDQSKSPFELDPK